MPLPTPEPGLVIRYSYLSYRGYEQNREEGETDRPCAIILTAFDEDCEAVVTVLPVTLHRQGSPTGC